MRTTLQGMPLLQRVNRMCPAEQTTLVATPAQHAACEVGTDKASSVGEDVTKAKTSRCNNVEISSRCTAQFPDPSLKTLKSGHHHIPSGPAVNMALVDQVLHVMTPAEWGKPIDVDEKWIPFVDENVKASTCSLALFAPG